MLLHAAAAPPGARVVRRSRARRGQHPEVAPAVVKHERPQQKVQRRRQKQPPVKAVEQPQQSSYQRPAWVGHRGPTLSGVLRPFEAVKVSLKAEPSVDNVARPGAVCALQNVVRLYGVAGRPGWLEPCFDNDTD